MNEIDFSVWLAKHNTSKKVCSDYISRLKKIEHSLNNCDLDEEYSNDKCAFLLALFKNSGKNEYMQSKHMGGLPIGKYYLAAYKFSIKKYIQFKDDLAKFANQN